VEALREPNLTLRYLGYAAMPGVGCATWGGSTRMLPYTPCDLARRSLGVNHFHDSAKQIVLDAAAGSGVTIRF